MGILRSPQFAEPSPHASFGSEQEGRTLLLTCKERALDLALARLASPNVVIWRTPGASIVSSSSSSPPKLFPLATTIRTFDVRSIILLGHCQCDCLDSQPGRKKAPLTGGKSEVFLNRIVQGLRERNDLRQRSQQHLLEQRRWLLQHPDLIDLVRSSEVSLETWLYLDESGAILRYDEIRDHFEPMTADAWA